MLRHAVIVLGFVKGIGCLQTKIVAITTQSTSVIRENWGPPTNKAGVNGTCLGPVQTYHHNQLNVVCVQPHQMIVARSWKR